MRPVQLSKMYSGYLAVGGEKYLCVWLELCFLPRVSVHSAPPQFTPRHYIYVASQSKTAATDPVVLWMNGGPGQFAKSLVIVLRGNQS